MTDENNSIVDQFGFDDDMNMSIDSNPEASTDVEKVRKLIEEDLANCSFDDLELKIFSIACPILRKNLIEIIEEIEEKLNEEKTMRNARAFDDLFVKCQSALEPWNNLMNHVLNGGKSCEPAKLISLIDNFPSVAIKISGHCKSNRQKYPKEHLPPLLSDVFKKSCGIVKIFCNILTCIINFSDSEDFNILRKVISEVGEIARLTTYDLVTMGQSWKTFMKLGVTHKDIILSKNCIDDIRSHFKHLGGIINSLYNNILQSSVELFEKRAKCTIFLLTILDRLHLIFCRANSQPKDDFIKQMLPILINISANHAICTGTKLKDHDNNLHRARIKIITSNFSESIMKHYTGFDNFWKILLDEFEVIKKNRELKYAIGYHAIVLSILEKAKPSNHFFDIVIQNIVYLQEEILIGSLEFISVNNEPRNIYNATLRVLIDFLTKEKENFNIYEIILMKNLMSEAFWPTLMSHDILSCLYRITNEELAITHIEQYLGAYENLRGRDDSLAVVIISRLIINSYEALSNESKEEIFKKSNCPNGLLLILKSRSSDESIKNKQLALYQKITAVEPVNSLPQVIADLRRQPTVENWNRMIELLKFMGVSKEKTSRVNGEKLCEISSFFMEAIEELSGWRQRILVDSVMLLFDCAEIDGDEQSFNWSLISVLFSRVARSADLPIDFYMRICQYLKRNAHRLNATTEENIPVLSNLFCVLLEHNDDFVRQEALEAYDHVVETCGNDDLVRKITKIIAQRPKLRKIVPAYLKKEILEEIPNFEKYLRNLCRETMNLIMENKHFCRDEEEVEEQDEKRFKSDENDYEKQAEDVCNNLKQLAREKNNLSLNIQKKLRNACLLFVGDY